MSELVDDVRLADRLTGPDQRDLDVAAALGDR
jgi:hypothetical protein